MLFLALLVVSGAIVKTLADLEGRNGLVWGAVAIAAGWTLSGFLGWFALTAPAIVIVGAFVALWIAKAIDAKRSGKPF